MKPPNNIFETITYGICHANSTTNEGNAQYAILITYLRNNDLYALTEHTYPDTLIDDKAVICKRLISTLIGHGVILNELTIDQMHIIETIKGVTKNTIALVYLLNLDISDERIIPYRDSYFIYGMKMLYNWKYATKEQIKTKTDTMD